MPNPEFDAFTQLVDKALAVPADTLKARVEEHRERAKRNPRRPGPKPKLKTSASDPASRDRA